MEQPQARTIRPADIISLIRQSTDKGFVERKFTGDEGSFETRPVAETAIRIEEVFPEAEVFIPEPGIPEAEVAKMVEAARAEGHAKGVAEEAARQGSAIAEAEAQLIAAKDAFVRVATRLSEVAPEDSAQLAQALGEAVRRLASERAGMAIDDAPTAFLRRIEMLADRVSQGVRDVRIRLNPGDFAAIHPHLETSETIIEAILSADLSLGRGDVIVRSESVRLEDIIAPAVAEEPAKKPELKPAP